MADETTTDPETTDADPPENDEKNTPENQNTDPPADEKPESGKNDSDLKAAKREAQNLRARLRAAEKTAAEAQKNAQELADKNSDLTNQVQRSQVERAVAKAAAEPQVGAKRPEALVDLIDVSKLTFDAEKGVQGVTEELERIREKFPELFHPTGKSDGPAGGGPTGTADMNALIRNAAGRR